MPMDRSADQEVQRAVKHRSVPEFRTAPKNASRLTEASPHRIVDIASSAARLRLKPTPPKAEKATRMVIRTAKRSSTWLNRTSCGVVELGHDCENVGSGGSCFNPSSIGSVARGRAGVPRVWNAGPAFGGAAAPRFDERAQDRKRKLGMTRLGRLVEPVGQLALARDRGRNAIRPPRRPRRRTCQSGHPRSIKASATSVHAPDWISWASRAVFLVWPSDG